MKIGDLIRDGIDELMTDISDVTPKFTWNAVEIDCIPMMADTGALIVIGGIESTFTCSLIVRIRDFLSADSTLVTADSDIYTVDAGVPVPLVGKLVTFRQKSQRILMTSIDASSAFIKVTLGNPNS